MQEFLQQLVNGISWGSIYALIALGYTMVYGVLQLINFAHGDVFMLGAFFGYYFSRWTKIAQEPTLLGFFATLLFAMAACALVGIIIERAAYKPLRARPRLTVLITAIGVSLLLENGGQLVFGADPKFFPTLIAGSELYKSSNLVIYNLPVIILVVSIALMVLLRFIVMKTTIGKAMRAVAFNREAASLMGININNVISFTFLLGSALAGAGGILVALSYPKIDPLMGLLPGLKAFVAAVLGGIGNIPGAVLGGMILGVSETMVAGYISSTLRDAIAFALLVVILLVKPTGLLGSRVGEKV
ncbi:MAG: branched-chain amino acid ABC transporter permease [candidate division Zixibacteria bacterium]|nr:branched-chain amino acid ABC transporter permease [candidate division Zixibacteria bacterium]MCI0595385.1 branched-chain amino acid ABC transporter permease [candidate division Zixibacteria bacterium]